MLGSWMKVLSELKLFDKHLYITSYFYVKIQSGECCAKDEARHGAGFAGLLKRYFG